MTTVLIQDAIGLLKQVPPAVWVAIAAPMLSLAGVAITLRHTRKLQTIQLAHDAKERTRERQMSWRREVYLYAAESVSRLSGLIGRVADLNVPDQEISRLFQDDMAKITRIYVIANDKTVAAMNAFTGELTIIYTQLSVDRALLLGQRNEIESLNATLQRSNEARERYEALLLQLSANQNADQALRAAFGTEIEVHRRKAQYCSQRRLELMNQLPRAQQALLKAAMQAGFRLVPLITPALFAVREELEVPLDSERYIRDANELSERFKGAVGTAMQRVDQVLADEDGGGK